MEDQIDVVLLEDNDDDADFSLCQLKRHPLVNSAVHFKSAESAYQYLVTCEYLPRLVLIDLRLTGMSGLEFLIKLRKHGRACEMKVAVLSGSMILKQEVSPYLSDQSYFFEKPLNANKVIHVMCPPLQIK